MANPIVAAVASFIIPGIGQIYVGETQKGIIFLVIAIILFALGYLITDLTVAIVLSIISLIYRLYAAYDAYQTAKY